MVNKRNNKYICPFCDVRPYRQNYFGNRIRRFKVDAYQVGTENEVEPPIQPAFYYDCQGCKRKYEDISRLNIKYIRAKQNVLFDKILRIYGNRIGFDKLLRHRKAIVRIIGGNFAKILKLFRRKYTAVIIIDFNRIRSFMTFTRKKTPYGEHYLAESLEKLA